MAAISMKTVQSITHYSCGTTEVQQQNWRESHKKMKEYSSFMNLKHKRGSFYVLLENSSSEYVYEDDYE